jgi:hypothetical protein
MIRRHPESEIFDFITGDFECAWDALAELPDVIASHRGNFMFALQATILLEWVCRLCANDRNSLLDFSKELQRIEPKYFTQLNDRVKDPGFILPSVGGDPLKYLLSALWDLIRNGNAHEYQDIFVTLIDGKHWSLGLQGVQHKCSLSVTSKQRSSLRHLSYSVEADGDLTLDVHPAALFLDISAAARSSNLLGRGLTILPFERPGTTQSGKNPKSIYQFDSNQLQTALQTGNLLKR